MSRVPNQILFLVHIADDLTEDCGRRYDSICVSYALKFKFDVWRPVLAIR
jgi:hypothetical protein